MSRRHSAPALSTARYAASSLLAAVSLLALGAEAAAQIYTAQPRQATTTYERVPEDYVAPGTRLGAFEVRPSLTLTEAYNDNVYKTENNPTEDFVTTISPTLALRSDWNNHEVAFLVSSDIVRYADNSEENRENYTLAGDFRVDVLRDSNFYGGAGLRRLYEDRGSPDAANGREPTEFDQLSGNVGYFHRFNRMSVRADGRVDRFDFQDVASTTSVIEQDTRDRTQTEGLLRVGYEVSPGWEPFVRGRYIQNEYRLSTDASGFRRNSDGHDIVAGTAFDLTRLVLGEVFAGYSHREFEDNRFEDLTVPSYGLALVWNVTPLTTVNGVVNRTIGETTQANSPGSVTTFYGISADTEVARNFVVEAGLNYTNADYEDIAREDHTVSVGVRARYYLNRNLYIGPDIQYSTRDAENVTGSDYDNWIFLLRVSGRI